MSHGLSRSSADDLFKLLKKHGINHGEGLPTELDSIGKLYGLLDTECDLPFSQTPVEIDVGQVGIHCNNSPLTTTSHTLRHIPILSQGCLGLHPAHVQQESV